MERPERLLELLYTLHRVQVPTAVARFCLQTVDILRTTLQRIREELTGSLSLQHAKNSGLRCCCSKANLCREFL